MITKIKSIFILIIIFIETLFDNFHRLIFGIPNIKRSQITSHLFLGSQFNKIGLKRLKALGVSAIINMRLHSDYEEALLQGIKYLHLPTEDNTPPSLEDLKTGADFADREIRLGGVVYVHCRQGLGRGPTMAIAYLIKTGLTLVDAYKLVKKVRPFINPVQSQMEKLKELEAYYYSISIM